jgi:hypothetical protein
MDSIPLVWFEHRNWVVIALNKLKHNRSGKCGLAVDSVEDVIIIKYNEYGINIGELLNATHYNHDCTA